MNPIRNLFGPHVLTYAYNSKLPPMSVMQLNSAEVRGTDRSMGWLWLVYGYIHERLETNRTILSDSTPPSRLRQRRYRRPFVQLAFYHTSQAQLNHPSTMQAFQVADTHQVHAPLVLLVSMYPSS